MFHKQPEDSLWGIGAVAPTDPLLLHDPSVEAATCSRCRSGRGMPMASTAKGESPNEKKRLESTS